MAATRKKTPAARPAQKLRVPEAAGISGDAVEKATGKDWNAWFVLLDSAGAMELDHKSIVAVIAPHLERSAWWAQMIAVAYEQERGLRALHESAHGFQVSVSRTLNVPLETLYRAFAEPAPRKRWLREAVEMRKSTPGKYVRMTWTDGTHVDVNVYAKGPGKSSAQVQHSKLEDAKAAAKWKTFWKSALARLAAEVEGK